MSILTDHLLSLILALPLVGAVIALAFPRNEDSGVRGFALALSIVGAALSCWLYMRFDPTAPGLQLVEMIPWVTSFGISYSVGVDGVAVAMVLLTSWLLPIVILSTYSSVTERIREYVVCLLLLQAGMLGAFIATDLFLFYVFWELMLIPMYFLIGVWGGKNRIYAAMKFFLYTMAGSLLMLVAILYAVWAVKDQGGMTFAWADVSARLLNTDLGDAEAWMFLAFALAFAIKVPMFPLHTWLPDAHVEAPTGGSVILAGVLLKLGTFGLLRYALWMFPEAALAFLPALALLATIGIVYGALVAMVQTDLKRLVAYSSVSHLGFVVLGIVALTVTGVTGGVVQMVNHGISTGALFLLVGVIYERRHTRLIADFGGLAKVMPRYTAIFVLITLSSIGLPGLNGFVGEFLILLGTFKSEGIAVGATTSDLAWFGLIALLVVSLAMVIFVGLALLRARDIGAKTRLFGFSLAVLVAVLLTAPPMGNFSGLLVRPLLGPLADASAFGETMAVLAVISASGVIFAAVYLLWAVQRVFFGPLGPGNEHLKDLSTREGLVLLPLIVGAVALGVYPKPLIDLVTPSVTSYVAQVRQHAGLPTEAIAHNGQAPSAAPTDAAPKLRVLPPLPGNEVEGRNNPLRQPRILPWRDRVERLRARGVPKLERPQPAGEGAAPAPAPQEGKQP